MDFPPFQPIPGMLRTNAVVNAEYVETPGVEPVFPKKDQVIEYAETRACFRAGEIRVLDANGKLERTIAFNETHRSWDDTRPIRKASA
jgi:hypothetical protein